MATLKLIIDKSKVKKSGECVVMVQISAKHKKSTNGKLRKELDYRPVRMTVAWNSNKP